MAVAAFLQQASSELSQLACSPTYTLLWQHSNTASQGMAGFKNSLARNMHLLFLVKDLRRRTGHTSTRVRTTLVTLGMIARVSMTPTAFDKKLAVSLRGVKILGKCQR